MPSTKYLVLCHACSTSMNIATSFVKQVVTTGHGFLGKNIRTTTIRIAINSDNTGNNNTNNKDIELFHAFGSDGFRALKVSGSGF